MTQKIKQPTLNEVIEHLKKHGGHLKARKGGIVWEESNE